MTVYKWSQTAASNATADSNINMREGMAPSQVNDSVRALMAAVAAWRDDMSGNLVTAGTSTSYTVTTNQSFSTLTDGLSFAARIHTTCGNIPVLNVDGRGSKAIASVYGTRITTGQLVSGAVHTFTYDSTDDKWIINGVLPAEFPSGTSMTFRQTAAPTGWTKDTTYTNAAFRVTSGSISQQDTAGNEFTTLLTNRTIAKANLPDYALPNTLAVASSGGHNHSITILRGTVTGGSGSATALMAPSSSYDTGSITETTDTDGAHVHTVTGSVTLDGSGTAMNFDVNYVDLIIATKN